MLVMNHPKFEVGEEVVLASRECPHLNGEQPDTVKADHRNIAELLLSIRWKDSSDAQWDRLRNAIPELRALLHKTEEASRSAAAINKTIDKYPNL